jgi:ribosomal protein S6--L-glutamate ligase
VALSKTSQKTIIGRQEFCDIPEAGLYGIRARIDTGAKTTALHAYNIELSKDGETGQEFITFNTHPENRRRKDGPIITLPIIDRRHVISSNGIKEERFIVRTTICLGNTCFETDMTLTSRHKMSFPILIGRNSLITGKFVVDVAKGYLLGKN